MWAGGGGESADVIKSCDVIQERMRIMYPANLQFPAVYQPGWAGLGWAGLDGRLQEALRVYAEMEATDQQPNTTTYNALISGEQSLCSSSFLPFQTDTQRKRYCTLACLPAAHSKGGDLSKVLQVFREMVQKVGAVRVQSGRLAAPTRLRAPLS